MTNELLSIHEFIEYLLCARPERYKVWVSGIGKGHNLINNYTVKDAAIWVCHINNSDRVRGHLHGKEGVSKGFENQVFPELPEEKTSCKHPRSADRQYIFTVWAHILCRVQVERYLPGLLLRHPRQIIRDGEVGWPVPWFSSGALGQGFRVSSRK